MTQKSDKQLVEDYLHGEEESLEILIKKYIKPIYSFIYRQAGNVQEAEDLTQETFVKVWRNLKKFDNRKEFRTWIFSIAKNTCIDFFRKKKTLLLYESENGPEKDCGFFEDMNIVQLLQSATEKLLPKYQQVLSFYHNEDLNFREISEKTGESINTIKSRYRRAILLLRGMIPKN